MISEETRRKNRLACKAYGASHREEGRLRCRRWRAKHPEKSSASTKKWQAKNPEKVKIYSKRQRDKDPEQFRIRCRAAMLLSKYGITAQQWDLIYEHQKGLCPICLKPIHKYKNKEGRRAANVEHDHKSKRVRGLTCFVCNRDRIGQNTVETAKRVVTFLESAFDGRNL